MNFRLIVTDWPRVFISFLSQHSTKIQWHSKEDITYKDKENERGNKSRHLWETGMVDLTEQWYFHLPAHREPRCWEAQEFSEWKHWGPVCIEVPGIKGRVQKSKGGREKRLGWKSRNRSQAPSPTPFPQSQVTPFLTRHRAPCPTHTGDLGLFSGETKAERLKILGYQA